MNKNKYLILILLLCSKTLFPKKIIVSQKASHIESSKNNQIEIFKDKHWLNNHAWFKIMPLQEILQKNPLIIYKEVTNKLCFDCPEFSISPEFPHKGNFDELFILFIPNGRSQGEHGHVLVNGILPDEMVRADYFEGLANIRKIPNRNIQKIEGKVAVIAQQGAGRKHSNYYHWLFEVLGRLAILEIFGVEYDYLYIGQYKKFMKETFELWGIDSSKIIVPVNDNFCIEAEELIVPSFVINTSCQHKHAGNFQHPMTSNYVRNKLLEAALKKNIDTSGFSKRVFISRKDSYNSRRILNEDQIFNCLETKGFKRYELSKLSVTDQILLFFNAEIVVSEQGSGLANILFCNPQTKIIEIFQALIDNCFWWVSNMLDLKYFPIKTLPVDVDYFANWRCKSFKKYYEHALCLAELSDEKIIEIDKFIENIL